MEHTVTTTTEPQYRVLYCQPGQQEWQSKEFTTAREAYAFKRSKRLALWAAKVQHLHADGTWVG